MSLILDALKRAERERRAGQAPTPLDAVAAPLAETPAAGARRWLLPALVGAIVAGGGVYLWLALRSPAPAPAAAAAPAVMPAPVPAVPTVPTPTAEPTPAATPTSDEAAPTPAAASSGPATLDDLVDDKQTPRGDTRPEARAASDEAPSLPRASGGQRRADADAPLTPADPLPPFEQPVGPPPPDAAPVPAAPTPALSLPAALPPAAPAVDPLTAAQASGAAPATSAARSFREMSPNYRAEFPTLSIDVHVYDANPQSRFVILNGKRYHEGETIAEGPRIVGIVADGIVFDYRGERVLYGLPR